MLIRMSRDSDRDGYQDRVELRYYSALTANDPTTATPMPICGRRSIPTRRSRRLCRRAQQATRRP